MQRVCEPQSCNRPTRISYLGTNPDKLMSNPTFAECFCAKYKVSREQYARAVFKRSLYRRTFLVGWLLPLLNPNYFVADFDLIYNIENLRRSRDFITEVARFNEHPANRGWLRRTFCFRVSTSRMKTLIRETLPPRSRDTRSGLPGDGGSAAPFGTTSESDKSGRGGE